MNCCRLSRDNSLIATGSDDYLVRVFKLTPDFKESEKIFELSGHSEPVNLVDISPNKKYLISSSIDKTCTIYNLENKGQII